MTPGTLCRIKSINGATSFGSKEQIWFLSNPTVNADMDISNKFLSEILQIKRNEVVLFIEEITVARSAFAKVLYENKVRFVMPTALEAIK